MNTIQTKLCLFLLFAGSITATKAQSLKQYIPSTSNVVVGLNWASLESKIAFTQFTNDQTEDDDNPFMALFVKVLEDPNAYGIDLKEHSYFFLEMGDTIENRVFLIGIADRKAFTTKALEVLKMNDPGAEFTRVGRNDQYAYDNLILTCSNDLAMIMMGKKRSYYNSIQYSSEPEFNYYRESRKINNQIDSMRYSGHDPYLEGEIELDLEDDEEEVEVYEVEDDVEYEETVEEAVEMEIDEDEYDEVYMEEADDYDYEAAERHPLLRQLDQKREQLEEEGRRNFKRKNTQSIKNQLDRYTTLKTAETYANNARFNSVMNGEHDLTLWINPESINHLMSKGLYREMVSYRNRDSLKNLDENNKLKKLMTGNYTYAYGDFNQGKLDLKLIQDRNEILQEFNYVKTGKINQSMIKYIPEESFGYIAANLSIPDYFESYRTFMMAMIESLPVKDQMTAAFEFMDIFINKDIFYNTFEGDGVFAFTGLSTMVSERYKYVYDEETFEREYKKVKDTTLIPEIMCMATIKKKENVERLILAFEHMKLFTPVGNNIYQVMKEPGKEPTPFYLGIHDGIFFVSNDVEMMTKKLGTGLAKADQISGKARTMLESYGNCQYWDSEKSFDAVLEVGKDHHPKEQGKIRVLQKRLSSGTIYTVENGSKLETDFSLNFSDSSINSLTEFVNLLHEFEIIR